MRGWPARKHAIAHARAMPTNGVMITTGSMMSQSWGGRRNFTTTATTSAPAALNFRWWLRAHLVTGAVVTFSALARPLKAPSKLPPMLSRMAAPALEPAYGNKYRGNAVRFSKCA